MKHYHYLFHISLNGFPQIHELITVFKVISCIEITLALSKSINEIRHLRKSIDSTIEIFL